MTDGRPARLPIRSTAAAAVVVVASTRAAAGDADDTHRPASSRLVRRARGWLVDEPVVVADGEPVGAGARRGARAAAVDVIVTTGGTGVSPTDATPEMTAPLLDRELPGIEEELRRRGAASHPAGRPLAGARRASPAAPSSSTCPAPRRSARRPRRARRRCSTTCSTSCAEAGMGDDSPTWAPRAARPRRRRLTVSVAECSALVTSRACRSRRHVRGRRPRPRRRPRRRAPSTTRRTRRRPR